MTTAKNNTPRVQKLRAEYAANYRRWRAAFLGLGCPVSMTSPVFFKNAVRAHLPATRQFSGATAEDWALASAAAAGNAEEDAEECRASGTPLIP